ncbi:MAG TPA: hypothetical protein VN376_08635 [Longilinea sp.]|nr:hypothetical protein [Longilinea sp.]
MATPSSKKWISCADANDVLIHNVPDPKKLAEFPFGNELVQLWDQNKGEFVTHGRDVNININTLLGPNPENIVKVGITSKTSTRIKDIQTEVINPSINGEEKEDLELFFRLAALYHDIGKYIIRERHPTIGRYTLEYLDPDEKHALCVLLNNDEDRLQLLIEMIQCHDQFGVLSTGEASYPILLNAISSWSNSPDLQKRAILSIMWLNIADMAGVPGFTIQDRDVAKVLDDLQWYMEAMVTCTNTKERLSEHIIQLTAEEERAIIRIERLLIESARSSQRCDRLSERNLKTNETRAHELVRNQLKTVYPTAIPRRDFAYQFTHVCKMDYAKRFFECLIDYCDGPASKKCLLILRSETEIDDERLIYAVLAILHRITSTYAAMIDTKEGPGNLIGVEMKDLTPANAKAKTSQICKLLLESHYPGLSWIMSDCPAWYF